MAKTLEPAAPERVFFHAKERRQASHLVAVEHWATTLAVGEEAAPLPRELSRLIAQVIEAIAHGGTVTVSSLPDELSTSVAADQLGISRPTLMKKIRNGEIRAHKVGSHHRLKSADVLAFKRARLARQRRALAEMNELLDELEVD